MIKKLVKNKLAYTWPLYIVVPAISGLLLVWMFGIYHRPNQYQQINVFFGTKIKDKSFIKTITNKFEKEDLKVITTSECMPKDSTFKEKLAYVGLVNSDILVLPTGTFEDIDKNYFVSLNDEAKETYFPSSISFYEDKGVLLNKEVLTNYLNYEVDTDYYLFIDSNSAIFKLASFDPSTKRKPLLSSENIVKYIFCFKFSLFKKSVKFFIYK